MPDWSVYGNPNDISITSDAVPDSFKVCVIQGVADAGAVFSGGIGTRIGSVFVIWIISTFVTFLPLIQQKFKFHLSVWFYLFARHFGAGVIVATAFVHLMDPAYGEIGPNVCVGMTGNWAIYSWPPALILVSIFGIFLTELASEVYVERTYGLINEEIDLQRLLTEKQAQESNSTEVDENCPVCDDDQVDSAIKNEIQEFSKSVNTDASEYEFKQQFAAFLILEFGVIFHSVIIGLNLGSCDYSDFKTLYPVLIFHQSFEGLGIGARLSAIPWPKSKPVYIKYLCCLAYGLVTPISIAIGLGVRTSYAGNGYTANVVSGVLDSLSAGILMYTGLVEFIARDFVFNQRIKTETTELLFSLACMLFGTGIMALVGKWA